MSGGDQELHGFDCLAITRFSNIGMEKIICRGDRITQMQRAGYHRDQFRDWILTCRQH